ncbi:MAG: 6-phosphogluconolactonase, partial [Actinomycetes bacterium]
RQQREDQRQAHDDRVVTAVHGSPKPPSTRITMTLPTIGAAREVWVLASGTEKAAAIRLALDPAAGVLQVPAAGARGRERTLFLIDEQAAAKLPPGLGRPTA